MSTLILCPCHSGKPYRACCQIYHNGMPAENALALMRSRYAAYALHLADYIIQTTSPQYHAYSSDKQQWKKDILAFSKNTDFQGLKILDFIDNPTEAWVTFTAYLKQKGQDVTFTEKSHFVKKDKYWLYEGQIL